MVEPEIERTSAVTTFLKFVHLGAIALWSGGLIALPFLFWQRRALESDLDLERLHRVTRLVYVELTSPAAFVAIGDDYRPIPISAPEGGQDDAAV